MSLAELRAEIPKHSFNYTIESWGTVWPEARLLAEAHARELGHERLALDERLMSAAAALGALQIYGLRLDSVLMGYICWKIEPDVEQVGRKLATQGPWYVKPELRGYGRSLFSFSIESLRELGVWKALPHHETTANGEKLGAWFESLGATKRLVEYELKLEDN